MSRRKQSNPKPAKRDLEKSDQSALGDCFPANQIYLRKFGTESLVLAKKRLPAGTVLGTYRGELKELVKEEEDSTLLKVNRCDGGSPVHVMLENEGHWLKLMRNAIVPTDANICLRISGREILCTVTKDVNKEVELKVTCRIGDQQTEEIIDEKESPILDRNDCENCEEMLNYGTEGTLNLSQNQERRESPVENLKYNNCEVEESRNELKCSTIQEAPSSGIKQVKPVKSGHVEESSSGASKKPDTDRNPPEEVITHKCPLCNFISTDERAFLKHVQSHRSPSFPRGTSHMTNSQSFCDACNIQFMSVDTYQVHKKYYCKSRHDKEELSSSSPVVEPSIAGIPGAFKPSADTVILRSGAVNGTATASLIQPQAIYAAISTNPLILLPCSLVSGEGLVAKSGGVIATGGPGIVVQTGIACPAIVEKSPSAMKVKDESLPSRKTSHPIMNFSSDQIEKIPSSSNSLRKRKMSEGDVLNIKKTYPTDSIREITTRDSNSPLQNADGPLDLSVKRKKVSNVINVPTRTSSSAHECSSPLHSGESSSSPRSHVLASNAMVSSPSHSFSNDSIHCYSSQGSVVLLKQPHPHLDRVSPSPPVHQGDVAIDKSSMPPGLPHTKFLKQGNNVCEECNIVFYKYDNFLAHKKHYCAYRRQQLSALAAAAAAAAAASSSASGPELSSEDNNSNHSGPTESSQGHSFDESSKSVPQRIESGEHFRPVIPKQSTSTFVCDACGVKYSSLDTLNAHQTYYCSKREDSAMSKFVRSRSENGCSPNNIEPPILGPEEWKCNYCDVTCSSYQTIRRHLVTHTELRGFRCLLCGYKGNTIRGMRTHASEHIRDGATSIEEFISSTVISENGFLPVAIDRPDSENSDASDDPKSSTKRERSSSESHKGVSFKEEKSSLGRDSKEMSMSPQTSDSTYKTASSMKMETEDSSPGGSHQESVNPMAFCDVVIKAENEHSLSEDESHDGPSKTFVKSEPELDIESENDDGELAHSESPPAQSISVIRCISDKNRSGDVVREAKSVKRKGRSDTKTTEMKYCKSCDISFYHMSNFIAHKKFYCSRPVRNNHQETTTVK